MSDGFIPPIKSKRPKNTKGLSLTAESLAPPPSNADDGSDQDYDLNAYVTQPTPRAPAAVLAADEDGSQQQDNGPSSGHTLMLPKVSKVSKRKPAGLGITSTRNAPDAPGSSRARDGDLSSPGSSHSMSSRAEMERELASMEISSSSSRSGSKLDANGSTNGSSKSTVKKTRKKSEKNGSNGSDSGHGFPELRDEDLKVVGDLGAGNGGTVNKVLHKETGLYMAKKVRYSPTSLRGLNIR